MRLGRSASTLALAAIIAASAAGSASAATSAPAVERTLTSYHNRDRAAFGVKPLRYSSHLSSVARRHATRMAGAGRIWHQEDLAWTVSGWKHLGDNVGRSDSVEHLHAGFMASPSHRDNILFWEYTTFGVGSVIADDGRIYAVIIFMTPSRAARPAARATAASRAQAPAPEVPEQTLGKLMQILALDAAIQQPVQPAATA